MMEINLKKYGENRIMEKNALIGSNPLITQEKIIMENFGVFQELWKNKG